MKEIASQESSGPMPVLFVGHGSPMNAVEDTPWSRAWRALGEAIPRPRAVLCISAHWCTEGTFLTGEERPRTLHDFGGFPRRLYEIEYPAPGAPDLARRAAGLLGAHGAGLRTDWGLDHGAWSVLRHLFPQADLPVVQLSIDLRLPPEGHLQIGRSLAPLRREGVLLLASGNIVHNLHHAFGQWKEASPETPPWAAAFDAAAAKALEGRDEAFLLRALESETGRMSHPTPEHYLPLLYAAGATDEGDAVHFPVAGFDMGSLSMRSVLFG